MVADAMHGRSNGKHSATYPAVGRSCWLIAVRVTGKVSMADILFFHMLHLSPGTVYLQTLHFLILNTVLNANSRLSYSNSSPD